MKKFTNVLSANLSEQRAVRRTKQVASVLERELASVLKREFELPHNVLVTIIKISVDADFELAKVQISVLPFASGNSILLKLQQASGFLQHCLAKRLPLYRLPKIKFVLDTSEERASELEAILDKVKKEE